MSALRQPVPPEPLQRFIAAVEALIGKGLRESELLTTLRPLLAELVAHDDWLPSSHARPGADRYRQYPLHVDPQGRFSIVSFVWGPGQATPIHDHTVWGLIGMLRGAEVSQGYRFTGPHELVPEGPPVRLSPGQVEAVSPRLGDIHRVHNAVEGQVSISIHVYGADIGRIERSTYDADGTPHRFVSGYSALA
ncbi:cysteine dioxygenase [Mitsuaria sp. 7]|uniref:cysteine dioxygenase family protein n=1 Tax=Mitsuaria sp. 7 TaxID=1658665 RepID=UPI0007DD75C3|nr:cysteine dioxygenase [Mitsuaria sp. 7]ANH67084.1 cysteine dioxygenase [Mitsuaria sp. 7]